jgi:hypothetical protein
MVGQGIGDDHRTGFFNSRGNLMRKQNEKKDKKETCIIHHTALKGDLNLCCCYIIDADGRYENPCYRPVADCC